MLTQEEEGGLLMRASMIMVFGLLAASIISPQSQEDTSATIGWLLAWLGYVALLAAFVWVVLFRPLRQTEKIAAAEAALRVVTIELAVSRDETAAVRKEAEVARMDALVAREETASARKEAVAARKETDAARAEAAARSPTAARGNVTVLTCTREKERVKIMPLRRRSSDSNMPSQDSRRGPTIRGRRQNSMSPSEIESFQARVSVAVARLRRNIELASVN